MRFTSGGATHLGRDGNRSIIRSAPSHDRVNRYPSLGHDKAVDRQDRADRSIAVSREELAVPRGGQPLPTSIRQWAEPVLSADLSRVRLHTGAAADISARRVNASAYTIGSDIVFARDRFHPESAAGRRLLAHELTHTAQGGFAGPTADDRGDWVEHGSTPPTVQRQVHAIRASDQGVQNIIDDRDPLSLERRLNECQAGTRSAKTFPFRATRFGAAPLSAHREGDGIRVKQPGYVSWNKDFVAQTQTLPPDTFTTGCWLPRWEVVKVHVYECPWWKLNTLGSTDGDRESEFCIPAEGLLKVSDASFRATWINIGTTGIEALSFGVGGKVVGALAQSALKGARTGLLAAILGTARAAPTALAGFGGRAATTISESALIRAAVPALESRVVTEATTAATAQAVRAEVAAAGQTATQAALRGSTTVSLAATGLSVSATETAG
ncbi:MAG: DUF4157 domain-containing protein, partial [Propionibacteriales bacterium]|nr:DUF4157 domain-containing protein [Propionibacteriales bacterium]